ncbi:MAG: ATP-binding protein [Campylobacterota bacterium]|nr:ATP-binding protein [Campylobacterota bacterium]
MNKVLISQNKHWENKYEGIYKRDILDKLLQNLDVKHIQVLQGIRRSGKSTLFKFLINHLSQTCDPQEILYVNLDDPFFIKYINDPTCFYEVIQTTQKLTGKSVKYIFLDEIQAINGWERYIKSAYDSDEFEKIFITGSNSTLLNKELATLLSGRYLSSQVYPLSFKELLEINKIDSYLKVNQNLPQVLNIVDDMMRYGSFIEVYDTNDELKRDILKTYYETIILKDCVSNNQIRDIKSFKELSYYCLTNLTSLYSYSSLAKAIGINDKSSKEYISYLEESYLFYELKLYSYSLKEQQNNKKKLYLSDNGFMELAYSFSSNYGKLFENLVFSELLKYGYEIYYYNKNFECDFIVKKDKKVIAIQVCYELNEQNRAREFNGLKKLPFDIDEKYLVTYNQIEQNDEINIISFWEFFYNFSKN